MRIMGNGIPMAHNKTERMRLSNYCWRDNSFVTRMFHV